VRPHCVRSPRVADANSFKIVPTSQLRRLSFELPPLLQRPNSYADAADDDVSVLTGAACSGHGERVTARTAPAQSPAGRTAPRRAPEGTRCDVAVVGAAVFFMAGITKVRSKGPTPSGRRLVLPGPLSTCRRPARFIRSVPDAARLPSSPISRSAFGSTGSTSMFVAEGQIPSAGINGIIERFPLSARAHGLRLAPFPGRDQARKGSEEKRVASRDGI
jgi:hypothetical protein